MKKIHSIALAISLCFAPLYAYDDYSLFEEDEFDALVDSEKTEWVPFYRACAISSPTDVLNFLTGPDLALQNRLQENFYIYTHPLNQRSLLDLPQFLLHLEPMPTGCDRLFNCTFFYNQTTKMNFTKESDKVESYLDIYNTNIFQGIDELIDGVPDVPIDIPTAQELFSFLKINERRTGFMFDWNLAFDSWNIEYKIPLYYFERNYYLTDAERRQIELLLGESDFGIFEILKIIMSDQVGFGDSRLQASYMAMEEDWGRLDVGAQVTLPTGWAFAKGLLGSNFKKNSNATPFDLLEIGQLVLCDPADRDTQLLTMLSADFVLSAVEKFSANLLQNSMGNNGHFGIGIFAEKHMRFNNRFHMKTRGAIEYLFPNSEKRFYITKKSNQLFLEQGSFEDQSEINAVNKLAFLTEQLQNTLIPKVYTTSIYPGFLVKFQSALLGDFGPQWEFGLGYDIWWQDKERLGRIKASPAELAQIRIDNAIRMMAYQAKFFALANHHGNVMDWGLYGDYTVFRTGIGQDFNISFRVSREF